MDGRSVGARPGIARMVASGRLAGATGKARGERIHRRRSEDRPGETCYHRSRYVVERRKMGSLESLLQKLWSVDEEIGA